MSLLLAATAIDQNARTMTRRRQAGSWVNGVWTPGAPTDDTINAVLMQVPRSDVMAMPEGVRERVEKTIWTRADLLGPDEDSSQEPDRIVDGADVWKVMGIHLRTEGAFTKAYLERDRDRGRTV